MNYSDNAFHLLLSSPGTGVFTRSLFRESLHFLMSDWLVIPLHSLSPWAWLDMKQLLPTPLPLLMMHGMLALVVGQQKTAIGRVRLLVKDH